MSKHENGFKQLAIEEGYEVVRGGWPDFLLIRGDQLMFVECKQGTQLSSTQVRVLAILHSRGFDVRIYDGDELVPYSKYLAGYAPPLIAKPKNPKPEAIDFEKMKRWFSVRKQS